MNKDELIHIIKDWIKNDNEIRALQKEQIVRKQEKKKITARLVDIMRNNEIDCFDINDSQILYKKKNVKKPLTKSDLVEILNTFYKGDTDKVSELNTFITENRKTSVKETIVRKIVSAPNPETATTPP
jgi:hypothetical protein